MATPLITFALPAYSRPELLAEALASIAAQTVVVDYEVVICDDGPAGWNATSGRVDPLQGPANAPGGRVPPPSPEGTASAPGLSPEASAKGEGRAPPLSCRNTTSPDESLVSPLSPAAQATGFPGGRCRYFHNQPALGAVRNWNRCLAEARGEWVTILHEDDLLYPEFLSLVLPRLRPGIAAVAVQTDQGAEPAAGWNAGPARRSATSGRSGQSQGPSNAPGLSPEASAKGEGRVPPTTPDGTTSAADGRAVPVQRYLPRYFLKSAMSPFPGVVLRRELTQRLGGFAEAWGPLADYEFWYRVACAGPVEVVRARGAFYRVAPGQWTERAWTRMLRLMHLLRLQMAREQFAASPRFGRWVARFFTYRAARSYARRFAERPAVLQRALRLGRIPGSFVPSGWVWRVLKSRA